MKKGRKKRSVPKNRALFYSKVVAFNAVNDPFWAPMVEGIAEFGPGFKPPSMHELRTWVLKPEVDDVDVLMNGHKKAWKEHGCTIMSDGWTDNVSRVLINFLVNSPTGTWFLKSIDASDTIKNGELMFNYLDDVIQEIGEENVVQIITDNAPNYVNAGKRLMVKRPQLYWTPCAADCIDLMLEDTGKLKVFEETISRAKEVVKFIYGRSWVLAQMRKATKNRELIRPAITRFATSFLTLQSFYKQKSPLQAMFSSEKWCKSSHAKTTEGVKARAIVLYDPTFWSRVVFCIKTALPLVSVLREVDLEVRPPMGYNYELMDAAKEKIAFNCNGNVQKYTPIWNKIDARWTPQLHRPLHAAGYYLNPQLRYEEKFSNVEEERQGLLDCMDRMLIGDDREAADLHLDLYDHARGDFGSNLAVSTRKKRSPADWWLRFGSKTPQLTRFVVCVLSLTCSASGSERNWSTFESIHTKKRNRLEHKRLNALVYVKYNTNLRTRSILRKKNIDPILVDQIDSDDEWMAEKEAPVLFTDSSWLDDDILFEVDTMRTVAPTTMENMAEQRPLEMEMGPSSASKKRKISQLPRSSKSVRLTPVDEEDDDEVVEIGGFDSGTFAQIDTLDDDDDDVHEENDFE